MSTEIINDAIAIKTEDEYVKYVPPDAETTCNICMAEFIDPEDLTLHIDQVHAEETSNYTKNPSNSKSCTFCGEPYTDMMHYAKHLRNNHIANFKACSFCSKIFVNTNCLEKHESKHKKYSTKDYYSCSQCRESFGEVVELKNHENTHHNNDKDGLNLQELLPYLSVALKIKASTFLQFIGMNTVYICVGCDYTTDQMDLYIKHVQTDKCKVFTCNTCSNTYKGKILLRRHLKKECGATGKMRVRFRQCPECKLDIKHADYRRHVRHCQIIKCYVCEITFNTMYELSEHQSKEHPLSLEVKTCKFCAKQCVGIVALTKHIDRSHSGELLLYKYRCVRCESVYKHPQKLFGHYFTKHKDLNPYTCKICNLEFRLRKKFTIHIKLQHESKGFVEFDENYHVFFAEKKSENPFIPKSIYAIDIDDVPGTDKSGNNMCLINGTDFNTVTETEGNVTEVDKTRDLKEGNRKKAKKAAKRKVREATPIPVPSSDDEPLLVVRKRIQKQPRSFKTKQTTKISKKKFTCKICNKYCYTYQNYNHHISLHSKKDIKKCIICSEVFRSKTKLAKHVTENHSTSKLTETLKNLLEKRRTGSVANATELDTADRFRRTVKKVDLTDPVATARIAPVENGLSVQKFIENFMPEDKTEPAIINDVSLKLITGCPRKPSIKMTKFNPTPLPTDCRLAMPVRFKDVYMEKPKVIVKLVQVEYEENRIEHYEEHLNNDSIPEVAEEVLLEGTEEAPKQAPTPHKIVIDKLPTEFENIRIAHMLPEAPYYKIVKVKDVLKMDDGTNETKGSDLIKLPDGTKLVTSNPLAHLLGKASIEKVVGPMKNKYYKPKMKDFQGALAQALSQLDKPYVRKKRKD